MKNKFLVKIIAIMCAASAIAATTPAWVSADPNKNINPKVAEDIIDQDSQNEKDKERNKVRKLVNDTFINEELYIPTDNVIYIPSSRDFDLDQESWIRRFARDHVKNPFDKFMYVKIASVHIRATRDMSPPFDTYYSYFCKEAGYKIENEKQTDFNFLNTKMAIGNMLIDQEKDLIKQLILKLLIYRDFLEIKDPMNLSDEYQGPYYAKEVMERLYCKFLKKYHKDDNLEYDVFADNLKIKQEAYEAALEDAEKDAENKNERDLTGKDEIFKKTYYEIYARANAEMDVRSGENRQHKKIKDKNMQTLYDNVYDNQYNEVAKQRGLHDFIETNSRYAYENDPDASKSHDEGYLMGIRKEARENVCNLGIRQRVRRVVPDLELNNKFEKFNKDLYTRQDTKDDYIGYFLDALRERGLMTFKEPELEDQHLKKSDWQEFLENNDKDQNIAEFKKAAKEKYIKGCVEGCRERGLRYAHSEGLEKEQYRFDGLITKDLLEEDDLYNQCKQAYDDGIKQGLNDLNLKNVKK